MAIAKQPLTIDIIYGRMNTPDMEAGVKRLYKQMKFIEREWSNVHPAPEFKIVLDRFGQVHIKLNERMMMHIFMVLSNYEDEEFNPVEQSDPPAWFMELMTKKDS